MRNVLLLILFGLVTFVGYSFWTDPEGFRQRFYEKFGGAVPARTPPAAGSAGNNAPDAPSPSPADVVIRELTSYVSQNTDHILAPIATEGPEAVAAPLTGLKLRLNSEWSRAALPAAKARLQTALQLAGMMEQAIAQRVDHVKRRRAAEYHEPPDTGSRTRISPAETTAKMRQAEFFVQGVDRKWSDLAAQYRVAIGRLMASLSA